MLMDKKEKEDEGRAVRYGTGNKTEVPLPAIGGLWEETITAEESTVLPRAGVISEGFRLYLGHLVGKGVYEKPQGV